MKKQKTYKLKADFTAVESFLSEITLKLNILDGVSDDLIRRTFHKFVKPERYTTTDTGDLIAIFGVFGTAEAFFAAALRADDSD